MEGFGLLVDIIIQALKENKKTKSLSIRQLDGAVIAQLGSFPEEFSKGSVAVINKVNSYVEGVFKVNIYKNDNFSSRVFLKKSVDVKDLKMFYVDRH